MSKVIILDELNFIWDIRTMDKVVDMWKSGKSFTDICSEIERPQDETFLLLIHLSRKGRINKRDNYIWGTT